MSVNRGPVQFNKEHLKCWVAHELFRKHQPAYPQSQTHVWTSIGAQKLAFQDLYISAHNKLMWHEKVSDHHTHRRTPVIHWTRHPDELLLNTVIVGSGLMNKSAPVWHQWQSSDFHWDLGWTSQGQKQRRGSLSSLMQDFKSMNYMIVAVGDMTRAWH